MIHAIGQYDVAAPACAGARELEEESLKAEPHGLIAARPVRATALGMSPTRLRRLLWIWPPYLGAGIRVRRMTPDLREVVVELPLRRLNRNPHGSHFGGSLYAMTDPFFALMLMHNLPTGYVVWDKSASIDFVAPGRSRVTATFRLSADEIATIRAATANGQKYLHRFAVDVIDADACVVAHVEKVVYIRHRSPARTSDDADPGT